MYKESSYNVSTVDNSSYTKVVESISSDSITVDLIDKRYKGSKLVYSGIRIETSRNVMCFAPEFIDDLLESLCRLRAHGYDLEMAIKAIKEIEIE